MKVAESTEIENVATIAKPPKCGTGGPWLSVSERDPVLKANFKKTGIKIEHINAELRKMIKYCHHSPVKINPQFAIVLLQP